MSLRVELVLGLVNAREPRGSRRAGSCPGQRELAHETEPSVLFAPFGEEIGF